MAIVVLLLAFAAGTLGRVHPRAGSLSKETLIDYARNSPPGRSSLGLWTSLEKDSGLPYTEVPVSSVPEIKLCSQNRDLCQHLYLRRGMYPESEKVTVDIGYLNIDHQVSGIADVSVHTSKSMSDSSRIGWSSELSKEDGTSGSVTGSTEGGIPGFGSVSVSGTVSTYKNDRWSTAKNGENSFSAETTKSITFSAKCPAKDATCTVATWTYMKNIGGRCYTMPFGDKWRGKKEATSGSGNISLGVFADQKGDLGDLARQYYDHKADEKGLFSCDLSQNLWWHNKNSAIGKYDTDCKFSFPLMDGDKLVSTQAMLVYRPRDNTTKPPMDFEAESWDDEKSRCMLKGGWQYAVTKSGRFYSPPLEPNAKRVWLSQEVRVFWPEIPKNAHDICPDAVNSFESRSDTEPPNDEPKQRLDQVIVISDGLEELRKSSKQDDGKSIS